MSTKLVPSRRDFVKAGVVVGASTTVIGNLLACAAEKRSKPGDGMQLGLVTYLWGQDWDLPTLITNCETTGVLGVELRTQHAHGVEPSRCRWSLPA